MDDEILTHNTQAYSVQITYLLAHLWTLGLQQDDEGTAQRYFDAAKAPLRLVRLVTTASGPLARQLGNVLKQQRGSELFYLSTDNALLAGFIPKNTYLELHADHVQPFLAHMKQARVHALAELEAAMYEYDSADEGPLDDEGAIDEYEVGTYESGSTGDFYDESDPSL
jgi:hypothetical protein